MMARNWEPDEIESDYNFALTGRKIRLELKEKYNL